MGSEGRREVGGYYGNETMTTGSTHHTQDLDCQPGLFSDRVDQGLRTSEREGGREGGKGGKGGRVGSEGRREVGGYYGNETMTTGSTHHTQDLDCQPGLAIL